MLSLLSITLQAVIRNSSEGVSDSSFSGDSCSQAEGVCIQSCWHQLLSALSVPYLSKSIRVIGLVGKKFPLHLCHYLYRALEVPSHL